MASGPENEEPGFEHDVNERSWDEDRGSQYTVEDNPQVEEQEADAMENAQEEAAEERKEGGYQ